MGRKDTIQIHSGSALYEVWFSDNIDVEGLGSMILARRTVGGMSCGAVFLCDHYCLEVKDC